MALRLHMWERLRHGGRSQEIPMNRKSIAALTAAAVFASAAAVLAPSAAQAAPTTSTMTFTQSNTFPSAQVQNWGSLNLSCSGTSCSAALTPQGDTFFGNEFLGFNLAVGATSVTLSSTLVTAG